CRARPRLRRRRTACPACGARRPLRLHVRRPATPAFRRRAASFPSPNANPSPPRPGARPSISAWSHRRKTGIVRGMDKRLLDILCDPVTKTPVRPLRRDELDALNRAIAAGNLDTVAGQKVASPLAAGLITTDRKVVYRIEDDIPVMLAEEGIGTLQLSDFPG